MASKRDTEEDAANVTEEEEEDESGPANSCRVARTVRRGRAVAPAFAGVLVIAPNRRGCAQDKSNPHNDVTQQLVRRTGNVCGGGGKYARAGSCGERGHGRGPCDGKAGGSQPRLGLGLLSQLDGERESVSSLHAKKKSKMTV
jgi:hypothetical protein